MWARYICYILARCVVIMSVFYLLSFVFVKSNFMYYMPGHYYSRSLRVYFAIFCRCKCCLLI